MRDDIILVTVDSLRADHCGWQSGTDLTPFLDSLSDNSVTFTAAISPGPRTASSVPETHTGTPLAYTEQSIVDNEDSIRRIKRHLDEFETLGQLLRDEGYTTVAFTANPWTTKDVGFETDFDQFNEVGKEGGNIHALFQGTSLARAAWLLDNWVYKDSFFTHWRTFYDDMISTINEVDGPVFAWIFLIEPHNPYLAPRADRYDSSTYGMYAGLLQGNRMTKSKGAHTSIEESIKEKTLQRLKDAYRDCIRSVDSFAERLLTDVDDDSVLMFHSDHGEAFGEHGTFGHQSVLYEENIHVPLLIHGAGNDATIDEPISTQKIPELIRTQISDEAFEPAEFTTEYAVSRTLDDSAIALRGSRWKYIRTEDEQRVYDLDGHGETIDMSGEYPSILAELQQKCDEFLETLPQENTSSIELSEHDEMKQHLRSLGYRPG